MQAQIPLDHCDDFGWRVGRCEVLGPVVGGDACDRSAVDLADVEEQYVSGVHASDRGPQVRRDRIFGLLPVLTAPVEVPKRV